MNFTPFLLVSWLSLTLSATPRSKRQDLLDNNGHYIDETLEKALIDFLEAQENGDGLREAHPEFDPFHQREDVMDFLARHPHRQTLPLPCPEVRSPNLFVFPQRHPASWFNEERRRRSLEEILAAQRQLVDSIQNHAHSDEDLKLIGHIGNGILIDLQKKQNKTKRSLPLVRLISDPEVRLDVPKTIENFGTATKNAFEDERAPMYHLRNLVGSSRNAVLSAMRIPGQNMLIPSDYHIVKHGEVVGGALDDVDESLPFSQTFKKVGEFVRDSIKSGQETAGHIGDVAHEARNILHSARHAAPRLIIPYSQIPAVKKSKKAILITPRILGLAQDGHKKAKSARDYVRLGHLMDAVGLSKPNSPSLDLEKIIFEPRKLPLAKTNTKLSKLYSRFGDYREQVDDTLNTLEDAKISVGAKNLRDFLIKMRKELTTMVHPTHENRYKPKHKHHRRQETKEVGRFIENLFDKNSEEPKNETVGAGLALPPELLKPFMGQATKKDLEDFHRDNGDKNIIVGLTLDNQTLANFLDYVKNKDQPSVPSPGDGDPNLGYVLGAINPLMLERMFNQTVKVNNQNAENPQVLFGGHQHGHGGKVGTSMTHNGHMPKHFTNQAQTEDTEEFVDTYNGHTPEKNLD